jgi:hypothetical protein
MSKMGSHFSFGHLKHKLWAKERSGVKLAIWLPTTKSHESTQFPCVKATWDIPLESSRWGLQLCFKPHYDRRSAQEVMRLQSRGNLRCYDFGTPTWEFRDKNVAPVKRRRVYYKGEGGGFPQVRAMVSLVCPNCPWWVLCVRIARGESCVSELLVVSPSTKSAPTMH